LIKRQQRIYNSITKYQNEILENQQKCAIHNAGILIKPSVNIFPEYALPAYVKCHLRKEICSNLIACDIADRNIIDIIIEYVDDRNQLYFYRYMKLFIRDSSADYGWSYEDVDKYNCNSAITLTNAINKEFIKLYHPLVENRNEIYKPVKRWLGAVCFILTALIFIMCVLFDVVV
jgi:hypothetical protein